MKFVIQRVTNAKCEVNHEITGAIEQGFIRIYYRTMQKRNNQCTNGNFWCRYADQSDK